MISALPEQFSIHSVHQVVIILLISIVVGFLSGLLGKGGSAIATPALQVFAGVPPFFALASPLPSTLPTTISASWVYKKAHYLLHNKVIVLSILTGIPATLLGSYASQWVSGNILMIITALFVCILGISFIIPVLKREPAPERQEINISPSGWKIIVIGLFVGGLSGLLANSGGVLFAPLFIRTLKLPVKQALACSLVVAAALAIPGTLAHWWLGHIDWWLVLILSVGSIPGSYLGARLAISLKNETLELIFGILLCLFGAYDIFFTLHPLL